MVYKNMKCIAKRHRHLKFQVSRILWTLSLLMDFWSLYLYILASFMAAKWHASSWFRCALVCNCCWILKLYNMVRSIASCHNQWAYSSSETIVCTLVSSWIVRVAWWAQKLSESIFCTLVYSCAELACLSVLVFC